MPRFSFIPLMVFREEDLFNIFRKFTLHVSPATNQIKRFRQKSYKKGGGLLNKHICEKKIKYLCCLYLVSEFR